MANSGDTIFRTTTPLTTAASPLNGEFVSVRGATRVFLQGAVAGGTTAVKLQGSIDGSTPDADFEQTFAAPSLAGAELTVATPFVRVRVEQTVADATKTKLFARLRD